ncbi:hypothetical protein M5D96_009257, partial [Drosophila gunungcola]
AQLNSLQNSEENTYDEYKGFYGTIYFSRFSSIVCSVWFIRCRFVHFKKLGQYCHKENLGVSIKNGTTSDKCARHCVMEKMGFVSNGKVNIDTLIKKGNIYAYNAEHQKAIETQCRSIEDARKCEVGFQLSECIQATGDRAMNKIPGLNRKFNIIILQSLHQNS